VRNCPKRALFVDVGVKTARSVIRVPMLERFKLSGRLAITVGVGLLSLGLSLWQLTVPGFFSFSDSGVYFAAAFHLVSGALPYRDFTFVQPPGILLLMSPVVLLSRMIGTHDGFLVARVVGALVTALNAGLLAWLVRHRGRTTMLIAGAGLALLPVASFVSSGVKLEPYLICFILLGSLAVFPDEGRGTASTRRLAVGGLLFGVAALIKLWAFFPFVALVICLVPRYRRRVLAFIGAAAGGFIVLCLPFFLSAPKSFVSQVFTEQLTRKATAINDGGVMWRLKDMTGFFDTSLAPTDKEVAVAFVALLVLVVVAYARRMEHETIDIFILLAALISVAGLLVGPDSFVYYGYFTAPFLLGVLGLSMARLGGPIRALVGADRAPQGLRRSFSGVCALVGMALVVALVIEGTSFYSSFTYDYGYYGYPFSAITNLIPAGSCVVSDQVSYLVFSNRLQSSNSNCPEVVDPSGMWMAWGYQLIPPAPTFVAEWKSYFESAQFVVLGPPDASNIPWSSSLTAWFKSNFYLVFGHPSVYIYAKDS
jgi:hypothetical protein